MTVAPQTFEFTQRLLAPLALDLYHPGGGVRPLIVFGYGGGFTKGARGGAVHQPLVQRLCEAGFAVAIPDYRLKTGPQDVDADTLNRIRRISNRVHRQGWPLARKLHGVRLYTACMDMSDAIRFCRTHANKMQISDAKIGMLGVSAGALTGNTLCYPPAVWRSRFAAPDALVSLCAPVVHPWRIGANGPPVWIIHGQKDRIVPSIASVATAKAASDTGANITVTIPADAPHVGISKYVLTRQAESGNTYFEDIITFLTRHTAV